MSVRSVSEAINKNSVRLNNNDDLALRTVKGDGINSTQITTPQGDLSVSPYTFTSTETEDFKINYVYFVFSVAITETITLTKTTTGIDEILFSESVASADNVRLLATENVVIKASEGEQFEITISNTGTSGLVDVVLKKEVI